MASVLTNKHLIAALIVAPILAIIAYFGLDYAVSERPHSAVAGGSYPLVAKSNCRYQSGRCSFKNGDVEFELKAVPSRDNRMVIDLNAELPLEGVKLALAGNSQSGMPIAMESTNAGLTQWQTSFDLADIEDTRLLIVVSANNTLYYGETETTFTAYDTGFSQTNIQ
ncbi:MAG: hypothetical protein AAFZ92_10210 [Pseudomonadota bacterium]